MHTNTSAMGGHQGEVPLGQPATGWMDPNLAGGRIYWTVPAGAQSAMVQVGRTPAWTVAEVDLIAGVSGAEWLTLPYRFTEANGTMGPLPCGGYGMLGLQVATIEGTDVPAVPVHVVFGGVLPAEAPLQQLATAAPADTNAASMYQAGIGRRAWLDALVMCNVTASAADVSVYLDADGDTYDDASSLLRDHSLAANDTLTLADLGVLDNADGNLAVQVGTADAVTFSLWGRDK